MKQKIKILRETNCPMLNVIFRATEELLWISIDTAKYDAKFIDIASKCLNKPMHKKLCEEICEKVDEIYNIKENKEMIQSAVRQCDKQGKRLPILTLKLTYQNIFNKEESRFTYQVIPKISLCSSLQYIPDIDKLKELHRVFILNSDSNGLNNRIFDLIMNMYVDSDLEGYDMVAALGEES